MHQGSAVVVQVQRSTKNTPPSPVPGSLILNPGH